MTNILIMNYRSTANIAQYYHTNILNLGSIPKKT